MSDWADKIAEAMKESWWSDVDFGYAPQAADIAAALRKARSDALEEAGAMVTEYLSAGGLFNPELMQHDKVRDMLIAIRALKDKP